MRVYIWCDGAAMPNGGPAGAGYVVVGGVHLLGSEALGDATNNVAEYMAVRNALRAAADAGATSAHVRMDSPVVHARRWLSLPTHARRFRCEADGEAVRLVGPPLPAGGSSSSEAGSVLTGDDEEQFGRPESNPSRAGLSP